jgi:uncharacterized protein
MKTTKPVNTEPAHLGASDLLAFIDEWGHPEWVVVAAEAPLDQVSRLLAPAHWSKQVFHDVPIRPARKRDSEIAPLVAVAQCANSSWTVAYLVISLPISEPDIASAREEARLLSSKLKTRALAFIGEDTSGAMGCWLYRNGQEIEGKEWDQTQMRAADKAFAALGLYLPVCYPCAERGAAWLAVTDASALRVGKADLIKFGERPEDRDAKAILDAVLKNSLPEVRRLLRRGVKPTREALSKAVVKAAWSGKHEVLKDLLKSMSDQRSPFSPGIVRVALSKGQKDPARRMEAVKLLLAAGADINGEGGEALRVAMREENHVLVNFLLEAGADVNVSNEQGSTPLHYAAFLGEIEFARLFLEAGAKLDIRNSDGKTPAEWAALHGRKELAKLLQQAAQA